jgi:hypothetical protein
MLTSRSKLIPPNLKRRREKSQLKRRDLRSRKKKSLKKKLSQSKRLVQNRWLKPRGSTSIKRRLL